MRGAGGTGPLLKSPRAWILVGLAVLSLAYEAFYTRYAFTHSGSASGLGFDARPVNGRLTVLEVHKEDERGRPTPAFQAGLSEGDKILALARAGEEMAPVRGLFDSVAALRVLRSERALALSVERGKEVSPRRLELALAPRGAGLKGEEIPFRTLYSRILLPLFCIIIALFVGILRVEDNSAFLASLLLFCFGGASWAGGYATFPPGARLVGLVLFCTLFSTWSYLFMRFFFVFPTPSPIDRRLPWLKNVLAAFPLAFTLWNINWAYAEGVSFERYARLMSDAGGVDKTLDILFLGLFALGYLSLVLNLRQTAAKPDRRRLKLLLVGSLGALPALVFYFYRVVMWAPPQPEWLYVVTGACLWLFPALFAYAVVKHRFFGIRLIVRRGLRFALLSRGFLFVEGILTFLVIFYAGGPLLAQLLDGADTGTIALATALVTMGVVLALRSINKRVMRVIEKRFFREAYDGRIILMDLSRAVRQLATEPFDLLRLVSSKVVDSLHPNQVAIFVKGEDAARFPRPLMAVNSAARKLSAAQPEDYVCLCQRQAHGPSSLSAPWVAAPVVLPAGSPFVKKLEVLSAEEPAAIEVGSEDPRREDPPCQEQQDGPQPFRQLAPRLLVPLVANRRLMGFIALGEKQSEEPYSREDKELLLTVAQQVALALDYGGFLREETEQLNLRHELKIAESVQQRLFPQALPEVAGLDYVGACNPARGVGGDYYDFIDLGEGRLGIALGDVTGKGISAALLMASLQAMLRIHCEAHKEDPDRLTADINRHMCKGMDANRFASFFYGIFDPGKRALTFVNAGHNPPMLFRSFRHPMTSLGALAAPPHKADEPCQVLRLAPTGMVLGVLEDTAYRRESLELRVGDVLVIFTDGVTEAMNSASEEYGEEALQELVAGCLTLPACAIRDRIIEDVQRFVGEAGPSDDITLIVAKVVPVTSA